MLMSVYQPTTSTSAPRASRERGRSSSQAQMTISRSSNPPDEKARLNRLANLMNLELRS